MSAFRPTPEQARAADPEASVWVTANAGTGKTRVLADRVLRLLLAGAEPESILCLTFTKAAAVEMTARIERDLAEWAVAETDDVLAEKLERLENSWPDAERLRRARRLFARVLDLPQGLPVMTIHSFCASLLRRFPVEAAVAPHFEQIDDRTAAEVMKEARLWVLGEGRERSQALAAAIERLSAVMAEASLGDLLAQILAMRGIWRATIGPRGGAAGLGQAIHSALGVDPNLDSVALARRACSLSDINAVALRAAAAAMVADGTKTNVVRGGQILAWLDLSEDQRLGGFDAYETVYLTKDRVGRKDVCTKRFADAEPAHHRALVLEQVRLVQLVAQVNACTCARRSADVATIAEALIDHYEKLKGRDASLDFDDLIERAAALLETREQRDWVLFKLDARLEHLLVDEAQDTSPSQWQIIERLVEEFGAGAGVHDRPRTLFVVGDEKQSIYSFQGADLVNFRDVHGRLTSRLAPREETLARSFRSAGAVLELVDAVSELPEVRPGLTAGGALPGHASTRGEDMGEVILWPLMPPEAAEDLIEPWALPSARRFLPSAEEKLAGRLADQIKDWLGDPTPLPSTTEPATAKDVLVLVSRRGRIQELVIRALKRRDIAVAGADQLTLTDHIAVQDLIALGEALLMPEDDLTLACLLKSPLIGLDEDALFLLAHDRGASRLIERLSAMQGQAPFDEAFARFIRWRDRADFVPPYELFCEVLNDGGRERLLGRLGPDAAEPIEAFLAQALAYEEGHPATLQGFLHWLALDNGKLKRDPEPARDEVRVMTVHGAKGLEAPLVILADAATSATTRHDPLIFDHASQLPFWRGKRETRPNLVADLVESLEVRQREERSRLLYVALTRAKDRLLIAGWRTRQSGARSEQSWHGLVSRALNGIDGVIDLEKPTWSDDEAVRCLRRGTVVPREAMTRPVANAKRALPLWVKPLPPELARRRLTSPSRMSDEDPPAVSPRESVARARAFGIELHRLLHQLAELPAFEREQALTRSIQSLAGDLDEPALAALGRQVRDVLDLPALAPVFGPGSRGEQPIIGRIGDVVVSGQIDRLAVIEDAVIMVDFKSGRAPAAGINDTPRPYLRQLAAYASLLERIYPGREVRATLVWTSVPEVTHIPPALLQSYRPG